MMRHTDCVTCDDCGVVAAPGPVSRGGHETEWFRMGGVPPGWTIFNDDTSTQSQHRCVKCTRKAGR